jgi:prevent-host-death family protein
MLAVMVMTASLENAVQVNILEAKNRLSQLIKSVQAGEEVVIANRGEPVARLVPAREISNATSGTGNARAILDRLERHPLPDYVRRSTKEIDAAIEQERQSWD